ncbi:hypothetical protein YJ03_23425 [Salmonella enterica subsp. enterica serovar Typhimurium]|nr:hypothetical protein [Salmonella enterica subsp. enterica serovar Stanley]ECG3034580.1 hypothetical protein [Salmonella enterica subsp. enterica serovar Java]ECJ2093336.1 hypothetical protein [Salmonella enterica]ECM8936977.1 hypothetical protein [Salmonella enterica subsp. enterica serovar Typhimurium]ECY5521946.1 hypothetical protein [Salmonella enterica subsp. enterica serovar Agona]EDB3534749.1 hypothetical protein [Salmonella enterica subsp. enterica serovar Derby]OYG14144.1 hypotheti
MFHTIVSIKNDGHYFCRAGGNRPDGLNEPVTKKKAPTAKVSPFYKKTIGYGLPDFAEELNYGVDLSTI